jgi:hypothetical protein
MRTSKNRARYDRGKLRYPSDLTNDEWGLVEPLIAPGRPSNWVRQFQPLIAEIRILPVIPRTPFLDSGALLTEHRRDLRTKFFVASWGFQCIPFKSILRLLSRPVFQSSSATTVILSVSCAN